MLRLQHISLYQFKNYLQQSFDFSGRITGICGKNGAGKTNLLDAIHYLCFTRSYFTRNDQGSVQQGLSGFRLEGFFDNSGTLEKATCILRENGRKEFLLNDEPYEKFSRHLGRYPCVVIAPDDAVLITGDSRERRHFLDTLLSQLDPAYLQQLIAYKKTLDQRNSLLKSFAETGNRNFTLLDVLDEQLLAPGSYLFEKRNLFIRDFLPLVKKIYRSIAGEPETGAGDTLLNLQYESDLSDAPFAELLRLNRQRDCLAQRSTCGIHRDELEIQLQQQPFKQIASQGQRKSLLFALKLAELQVLEAEKKVTPLLLLDDVFEKLDEDRIRNLLQRVCVENSGQVFITDTNAERLRGHIAEWENDFQLIRLLVN